MVEKYCYNDTEDSCTKYGGLYQWAEMMALPDSCNTRDCASSVQTNHQGICPMGWHIPKDAEWKGLMYSIGTTSSGDYIKTYIGTYLKSTTGWSDTTNFAKNASGFSALPAGYKSYYGSFYGLDSSAYFWSASQSSANSSSYLGLREGLQEVDSWVSSKVIGYSVRCVMD